MAEPRKVACCFCTSRNPEKIGNEAPPVAFGGNSKEGKEEKAGLDDNDGIGARGE
jgi:hypothetical protein